MTLDEEDSPVFVGRRQEHFRCRASAVLDFDPRLEGEQAGMTVLMNSTHHFDLAVTLRAGRRVLVVDQRVGDVRAELGRADIPAGPILLEIQADAERYTLGRRDPADGFQPLAKASTRDLSSELAGGFTGVYIGLYASGAGRPADVPADFDWFQYETM